MDSRSIFCCPPCCGSVYLPKTVLTGVAAVVLRQRKFYNGMRVEHDTPSCSIVESFRGRSVCTGAHRILSKRHSRVLVHQALFGISQFLGCICRADAAVRDIRSFQRLRKLICTSSRDVPRSCGVCSHAPRILIYRSHECSIITEFQLHNTRHTHMTSTEAFSKWNDYEYADARLAAGGSSMLMAYRVGRGCVVELHTVEHVESAIHSFSHRDDGGLVFLKPSNRIPGDTRFLRGQILGSFDDKMFTRQSGDRFSMWVVYKLPLTYTFAYPERFQDLDNTCSRDSNVPYEPARDSGTLYDYMRDLRHNAMPPMCMNMVLRADNPLLQAPLCFVARQAGAPENHPHIYIPAHA